MRLLGRGPTAWHSAAARAPGTPSKCQRSRARSGQLQCRVGRGRRPDPFPLRSVEACASTLQASDRTPQAAAASRNGRATSHAHQLPRHPIEHPRQLPRVGIGRATRHAHQLPRQLPRVGTSRTTSHAHQLLRHPIAHPRQLPRVGTGRATRHAHQLLTNTLPRLPAQQFGIQLPRAHRKNCQNANDLAREAVSCNAGLGRPSGSTRNRIVRCSSFPLYSCLSVSIVDRTSACSHARNARTSSAEAASSR